MRLRAGDSCRGIDVADTERKLHSVAPPSEEYRLKIKKHRMRIGIIIAAAILIVAAAIFVVYYWITHKEYKNLETISTTTRTDSKSAQYLSFAGNMLKLTNDGATYTKKDGSLIWNQTFEMDNPQASICEKYSCLYEVGNNMVYIMDNNSACGSIITTTPVVRASIAAQGNVALLMEADGVSYLQLYDKKGTQIAAGEIHAKNSGYPIDIALSPNGEKLAVSIMDINTGGVNTSIVFYNFGNVGQNEVDKIVGTYLYENTIIPQLEYMEDDTLVAIADDGVLLFAGSQRPVLSGQVDVNTKIQSVFTNKKQVGLVFADEQGAGYSYTVLDTKGNILSSGSFNIEYENCEFLESGDICIYNEENVIIYTIGGTRRLEYQFYAPVYKVFSESSPIRYSFLLEEELRSCRLK